MRPILVTFISCAFAVSLHAQSYSITKIENWANGTQGALKGIPGDFFAAIMTFSNSSNSTINVFIDRYKNDIPPYWKASLCYLQCHSANQDTLTVEIPPNSTEIVSLQFKTDSVNPGIGHNSFKIFQIGFPNTIQNVDLTASTLNDVGILERQNTVSNIKLFPNPSGNYLSISLVEKINNIKIYDALGQLIFENKGIDENGCELLISNYPPGSYFVEVYSEKNKYVKKFIKN